MTAATLRGTGMTIAVLALLGCPRTPSEEDRLPPAGQGSDVAGVPFDVAGGVPDGWTAGMDVPGIDLAGLGGGRKDRGGTTPGPDGTTVTPTDPGVGTDTPVGADPGPIEPEGPPQVVSAFSADGETITVRFNRMMDESTTSDAQNFEIRDSRMGTLEVAMAIGEGKFSKLILAEGSAPNPSLTYKALVSNVKAHDGILLDPQFNSAPVKRTLYLAIVWHQHQPLYLDPVRDALSGPWVRKHATKDYYDMAAILAQYPDVHVNMNLTVVLLRQLQIYLDRLGPYVDEAAHTVDEAGFLAAWKGRTDPWIDLLLEDTPGRNDATKEQLELLYQGPWACVSTSDATMSRFPEYVEIREMNPGLYDREQFLRLKIFFELAWFDPDFLNGPVTLPDGNVVDLSDVLNRNGSTYTLAVPASEELANRLVADNYLVMKNVVPIHRELAWNPETREGQIELLTTPFYHPILPLINHTDSARAGQPWDSLPDPAYSYPDDAAYQVERALSYFEREFGVRPRSMWPAEGSVHEDVIRIFAERGVEVICTDQQVLERSRENARAWFPYRVDSDTVQGDGGDQSDEMLIVFRDTELSNGIGFRYQSMTGHEATNDLFGHLGNMAPRFGADDRLVTIILDGENAWEEYRKEPDGKGFFHALYGRLTDSDRVGEIMPVALTEYIDGNPDRGIPPHPIHDHTELEPLWGGSWIDATYAIWIGETEENIAWSFLKQAREDLGNAQVPQPSAALPPPADLESEEGLAFQAWDALYAAEGSDWFWWYGDDMTNPSNDDSPFDLAFRTLLAGAYDFANRWRAARSLPPIAVPDFPPIIQPKAKALSGPYTEPPTIDGKLVPSEAEWSTQGALFFDKDSSGTIANADDDIGVAYYGYDADAFYIGIVFNEVVADKLGQPYHVSVYFSQKHVVDAATGQATQEPHTATGRHGEELIFKAGGAAYELLLDLQPGSVQPRFYKVTAAGAWLERDGTGIELGGPLPGGKIIELKVAHATLSRDPTDPLEIQVVAVEGALTAGADAIIDAAPNLDLGAKAIFEDPTNQVYVSFQVDVSGIDGSYLPPVNNLPAPRGKGPVDISGHRAQRANWTPNKIPMLDDGQGDDAVAGDEIWTLTLPFERGVLLRWKYTIGMPKDEDRWPGTEEYPLTERGLTIPKDPTLKKIVLKETFGDRPAPTGTLAGGTVMEEVR